MTLYSHGTFQLDVELEDVYRDLTIKEILLYEFAPTRSNDPDPYVHLAFDGTEYESTPMPEPRNGYNIMYRFTDKTDRLLKWVVKVDPTAVVQGCEIMYEKPCCADVDDHGNYVFEGYAADMTQYERSILESINLCCNDCEVPRDLLIGLLKLFAVRAAVESKSPYTEMIFSKIACKGAKYPHLVSSFSRKCNCNG